MTRRDLLKGILAGAVVGAIVPTLEAEADRIRAEGPYTPLPVFHPAHPGEYRF